MSRFRGRIPDFTLANPLYVGATVTFYQADTDGELTTTVATLYAAPTGATTLANPQVLDSEGKFAQPVYFDTPVIAVTTGSLAGSLTTGVISPRGTHKGDYAASLRLSSGDTVRDATTGSFYAAATDFVASGTLATDVSAGDLEVIVDAAQILTDLTNDFAKAIDLSYEFSATTSMADPGAGTARLNNAALGSVTAIALDDTTAATGNPDVSAYLTTFDDSSNPVKGYILVRKPSAPQNFAIYRLTGLTDNSGWVQLAVTHIASSGSFSASDVLTVTFQRSGDQGNTVSSGVIFDFDSATTMADPGTGEVRLNHATPSSVTALAISDNTASTGNPDVSGYLVTWDDSTATNKGLVTLKKVGEPEKFAIYQLTALTDNSGWVQLNVSHVASAGTFTNGDELSVEFVPTVGAAASAGVQDVPTSSTTLAGLDAGKVMRATVASTFNLTAAATLTNSWYCFVYAQGGDITIDPNGSETVNGKTSLVIEQGDGGGLFCDGSNFTFIHTMGPDLDARRNRLTNPCMQVSQENGNSAGTTDGYFPADEWKLTHSSDGAVSVQRVQVVTPAGAKDRIRLSVTTADATLGASQVLYLTTPLEGSVIADLMFGSANAVDVVIRVGITAPEGTYALSLRNAASNRAFIREIEISASEANSDVVKEFVIPGDVTGTWPTGDVLGMQLSICFAAGSGGVTSPDVWAASGYIGATGMTNGLASDSNVFEVWDAGYKSDPDETGVYGVFEVPDVRDVLEWCRRQWRGFVAFGAQVSTTAAVTATDLAPPMRIGPTATVTTYWIETTGDPGGGSVTGSSLTTTHARLYTSFTSGGAAGRPFRNEGTLSARMI